MCFVHFLYLLCVLHTIALHCSRRTWLCSCHSFKRWGHSWQLRPGRLGRASRPWRRPPLAWIGCQGPCGWCQLGGEASVPLIQQSLTRSLIMNLFLTHQQVKAREVTLKTMTRRTRKSIQMNLWRAKKSAIFFEMLHIVCTILSNNVQYCRFMNATVWNLVQ